MFLYRLGIGFSGLQAAVNPDTKINIVFSQQSIQVYLQDVCLLHRGII